MKRKFRTPRVSLQAGLMTLSAVVLFAVLVMGFAPAVHAVSEETPPKTCGARLLSGIKCSGRYCDNIGLQCWPQVYNAYNWQWTRHVSEENGGQMNCNVTNPFERGDWPADEPAFITGISCNGSYCDNVSLECVALRDHFPSFSGCDWTVSVSEERGRLNFPAGRYAVAMKCSGSNCDNKSFLLCDIRRR